MIPGKPAKVPHIRMQLALDAEDRHQNITDNNNEVLDVAYSASPIYHEVHERHEEKKKLKKIYPQIFTD